MPFSVLSAPNRVTWDISSACNLKCVHCYNASGKKTTDEIHGAKVLKVASELVDARVLIVTLSGGEVFLKPEMWDVIPILTQRKVDVNLITNGTLITNDIAKRLSTYSIRAVQVSLDGSESIHNLIRGDSAAFERTISGIKNLLELGVNICISMTVFRKNLKEVEKVMDISRSLGVQEFRVLRFIPMGRGREQLDFMLSRNEMKELVAKLLLLRDEYKGIIRIELDESISFLDQKDRDNQNLCWNGCLAARTEAGIDSSGNFYPCIFLTYPEFSAGNLVTSPLKELWHSEVFSNFRKTCDPCTDCLKETCLGGCPAVSYSMYRNLTKSDPYCWKYTA